MSFIARSRANSELSSSSNSQRLGVWVNDLFHRYQFPRCTFNNVTDHHNNNSNNNGGGHRVEIHFLGLSYLQSGPHCVSSAAFYEITETSDTLFLDEIEQPSLLLSSSSSPILSTENSTNSNSNLSSINNDNNTSSHSDMLPPKKRRRHKVIRNDVIFCIDPPPASDLHTPSPHLDYFLFPHDAVAGPVNDAPPFEILFSFHVLDTHVEERRPTKLEEFAALCSSANRMYPRRRSTDPGSTGGNLLSSGPSTATTTSTSDSSVELLSNNNNNDSDSCINTTRLMTTIPTMPVDDPRSKVVNMRISGVSRRLFIAIKQTVSEFETVCEKMVQLMTYHTQQMAGQKGSPTTTTASRSLLSSLSPSPPAAPTAHSEWEELLNSRDNRYQYQYPRQQNRYRKSTDVCSSDDTNFDKDDMLIDSTPKTRQSVSVNNKDSRWPTSPRSAPTSLSSNSSNHSNNNNSSNNNIGNTSSNSTTKINNNNNSKSRSNSNGGTVKKCLYCGSKSTPMWRRGPQGAGTLCNACGVKWKHGKILQNSSATENSASSTQPSTHMNTSKERRGSSSTTHKNEKKRKKSTSNGSSSNSSNSGGGRSSLDHHHYRRSSNRSASTTSAMETLSFIKPSPPSSSSLRQNNHSDDNDDMMENNINAARNLSIREDEEEYHHHRFLSSSVPSNKRVDTFAVPWLPRDSNNNNTTEQQQRQMIMTVATDNISSSSHSISGSYSPIDESSPNSSPRLSSTASSVVSMQQQYYHHNRRHTMDVSMADKFDYNSDTSAFAISAGVDAVEAAAVLTLLKRS